MAVVFVSAVDKINEVEGRKVVAHRGVEDFIKLSNSEKGLLFKDFDRALEIFPDSEMEGAVAKKVSGKSRGSGSGDVGKRVHLWLD